MSSPVVYNMEQGNVPSARQSKLNFMFHASMHLEDNVGTNHMDIDICVGQGHNDYLDVNDWWLALNNPSGKITLTDNKHDNTFIINFNN
jgi:hypothetical protein